jgi:phosphohistidine swiveling domain-containing protein
MGAFIIFPLFIEEYLENYVKTEITKKCGAKAPEIIHNLGVALKSSSTENDELSLLKIALKRQHGLSIETDIKRHIQNYGWLKNSAMNNSYYSEKEIYRRLDSFRAADISEKIKIILSERRRKIAQVKKYKTEFGFSKKLISHIDTLQEAIYFRSWRTEQFYRNIQYLSNFLGEISKRLGIKSLEEIFYILPTEVINLLRQELKIDFGIIKERKRGYIMVADGRHTQIYSGDIVASAKKKIKFLSIKKQESNEIKGQTACRGLAVGKVHIIKSKTEFKKFKVKEILVVPSTTPDYVPVMKKAAAIITDEGGLTCHAAIMSRELKTPCIIGTKIGTKVLRDGDLVEVDAEKGIIKILKKA